MTWVALIFAALSGWLSNEAVYAYFSGTSLFSARFYCLGATFAALQAVWLGGLL